MSINYPLKNWMLALWGCTLISCGGSDTLDEWGITRGKAEQVRHKIVMADYTQANKIIPPGVQLKEWAGEDPSLTLVKDQGTQALRLFSKQNSFALIKDLELDFMATPYLSWDWNVTELPTNGDYRNAETDDQAAQLVFAFSDTNVLSYIWDSNATNLGQVGDVPISSFVKSLLGIKSAKVMVIEAGDRNLATWITEQRNLLEDYRTVFKQEPPAGLTLKKMLIQINSQHTKSSAESYWRSVILSDIPMDIASEEQPPLDDVLGMPTSP